MVAPRVWQHRVAFALSVLTLITMSAAWADVTGRTVYLKQGGSETAPYRIVLKCDGHAEDSMAHLKLKRYTPEKVVYKCQEGGY